MAIVTFYHGGPGFDPGLTFADAIANATGNSGPTAHHFYIFNAGTGAMVDFFLNVADTRVIGFQVFNKNDNTVPPLVKATGYNIDGPAFVTAITAYAGGDVAPLLALLNVRHTYNGSPDADNIYDLTTFACRLNGYGGNDFLWGGVGRDTSTGGPGADHFAYAAKTDSLPGATHDMILDFNRAQGDKVDFALVDADQRAGHPGNQAFHFIGNQTFVAYHAAHPTRFNLLRFDPALDAIQGNVNAGLGADMEVHINVASMVVSDFVL